MGEERYKSEKGHPALRDVKNGTEVRYEYKRGRHSGKVAKAEIREGHIIYNGERYSPSSAARAAMRDIRGDDYQENGWEWWKYYDDDAGEWRELKSMK